MRKILLVFLIALTIGIVRGQDNTITIGQQYGRTPLGTPTPIRSDGAIASSTANLSANGVYNTGWMDMSGYKVIYFYANSDQSGTVAASYAQDTTNPIGTSTRAYAANTNFRNTYPITTRYVKYIYTNSSVAQGRFFINVYLSNTLVPSSDLDLNQRLNSGLLASTTRSVIELPADTAGNSYNVVTRTAGSLNVHVDNPATVTFPSTQNVAGTVAISNFDTSVSITSSVLPAGASTAVLQTTGNTSLGALSDAAVVDPAANGSVIALLKGLIQEIQSPATAATFTAVSLAANVAQTLAANTNAKGRLIFSTNGTILIGFGFTATATNYSVRIVTNGFYEVPPLLSTLPLSLFSTAASTVNVTTPQ